MLTDWKKQEELDFLNEVSCVPLQQGLRHLQTAFTNKQIWANKVNQLNYPIMITFNLFEQKKEKTLINNSRKCLILHKNEITFVQSWK